MQNRQTFSRPAGGESPQLAGPDPAVTLLLAALGFTIGYGTTGYVEGAFGVTTIAIVLAMLLSVGSYFAGDKLVLAASGAKEVTQEAAPQLHERRPRDLARRGPADAEGVRHRRHGAERLRHRA